MNNSTVALAKGALYLEDCDQDPFTLQTRSSAQCTLC